MGKPIELPCGCVLSPGVHAQVCQEHALPRRGMGEIAYTAYREHTGHKSAITGLDIPPWGSLSNEVKAAWEVAADAVADAVREADTDPGATPTHG